MRKPDDEGFGLVEMVIAFFLLAIIAVAILPTIMNGIAYASQQSSTATATRYVNSVIENARNSPTCAAINKLHGTVPAPPAPAPKDGRGAVIAVKGTVVYTTDVPSPAPMPPPTPGPVPQGTCGSGANAWVTLKATQGSTTLATASALIYVP